MCRVKRDSVTLITFGDGPVAPMAPFTSESQTYGADRCFHRAKKTSSSASPHRRSHQSRQRDAGPQPRTRKKLRIDAWYATLRYPRTPMSSVTAPVGCGPTTAIATRSHDRRIPWPRKKLRRSPPRRAPRRPRSKSGQSAYLLPFIALAVEPQGSMLTMDGSSRFIHPMIADSESDLLPRASATESRPG